LAIYSVNIVKTAENFVLEHNARILVGKECCNWCCNSRKLSKLWSHLGKNL